MTCSGGRHILMTSPVYYEVCYSINPWMQPETWSRDPAGARGRATAQWSALVVALREAGATVEIAPGEPGLPDMVFPANAAIVFNGRTLLSRFRYPQRRGEEASFRRFFHELASRGDVAEVAEMAPGVIQEGAGDCIWDARRGLFWAGYGPRSGADSPAEIANFFGETALGLELATERYYHLDTCFCAMPGGEVLYYPGAFTPDALRLIEAIVPAEERIPVTESEAATFCLNAVSLGRDLITTAPPPRLRSVIEERGYRCRDVDLSSFMMSGGGAYCMTLRLDLGRAPQVRAMRTAGASEDRPGPSANGETPCSPKHQTSPKRRAALR